MADQYYKSDTLKLCYIIGCVCVLLCILGQYLFISDLVRRNTQSDSFTNRTDSSNGGGLLLMILVTMIAGLVVSSIISSKGDAVIAFILRIVLIISLIISFVYVFSGIAGHSA
jgi:hypothetical protein